MFQYFLRRGLNGVIFMDENIAAINNIIEKNTRDKPRAETK